MLNNNSIKNLTPKEKRYRVNVDRGLYLEITPTGKKFWRFRYSFKGKKNIISIGPYPEISLSDARKKRDELRVCLRKGIDIVAEKKKQLIENKQRQNELNKIESSKLRLEKLKLKAENGNKNALYQLALIYFNGSDEYMVKQDKKLAFDLLLEALEKGNKFAKETLKLFKNFLD